MSTHRRVEDKFRSFKQMQVPNGDDSVRVVSSRRVLVVRRHSEFWKLIVSLSSVV